MNAISGLQYFPEYISEAEEQQLLALVESHPWMHELRRRVQHYGYCYDYRRRSIKQSMALGGLPDWLNTLGHHFYEDGFFTEIPDQVIINEYLPGMGIAPHVDCEPCFKGTILSLSLESACVMDFTHVHTGAAQAMLLQPRSLLVLKGEARYDWKHGIAPRKSDYIMGQDVPRGRRVSLTFRKVILS